MAPWTASPGALTKNGSFRVMTGFPSRYARVRTLYDAPSAPVTGIVWALSVTELKRKFTDFGGLRLSSVKVF